MRHTHIRTFVVQESMNLKKLLLPICVLLVFVDEIFVFDHNPPHSIRTHTTKAMLFDGIEKRRHHVSTLSVVVVQIILVWSSSLFSIAEATVTTPPPPTTTTTNTSYYKDCHGNTSICYGFPNDCVQHSTCNFMFKSIFNPSVGFTQELYAPNVPVGQYISVGFSNKSAMSGIVIQCYYSSNAHRTVLESSFNEYKRFRNDPIQDQSQVHGLSQLKATYKDGVLWCQWKVPNPGRIIYLDNTYDFEKERYYIQLASGMYNEKEHKLGSHHHNRSSSSEAINLKVFANIHPHGSSAVIQWHAALMIFGWIGCFTVSIIMARFTRNMWPDKKLFGQKYWFVVHRYLMIIGFLAILISYIIVFIKFKGWNKTSPHSVIGIVSGILAALQIVNSYFRPNPESKHRWIFNYGHWFVGNTAHVLAVANIINSGLKRSKTFLWLLLGYLFVYLVFSDLLRKVEYKMSSISIKTRITYHFVLYHSIITVVAITAALMGIMFNN